MYKVERDITMYDTIEEINAKNGREALEIAKRMFGEGHEDIIYEDQKTDVEYCVVFIGE